MEEILQQNYKDIVKKVNEVVPKDNRVDVHNKVPITNFENDMYEKQQEVVY